MIPQFVLVAEAVNEYFDGFDCQKCLWCLAAELDFNLAGFTVVACVSGYA